MPQGVRVRLPLSTLRRADGGTGDTRQVQDLVPQGVWVRLPLGALRPRGGMEDAARSNRAAHHGHGGSTPSEATRENSGRWRNPVDAADLNPAGPAVRVRLSRAPPVGRSFQLERRRSPKALFLVRVQVGPPPCVRRSMEEPRPSKPLGAGSIPVGRAIDALIAQLERVPLRGGGG